MPDTTRNITILKRCSSAAEHRAHYMPNYANMQDTLDAAKDDLNWHQKQGQKRRHKRSPKSMEIYIWLYFDVFFGILYFVGF